jgi:K+-sensing histidine kinase KdpD
MLEGMKYLRMYAVVIGSVASAAAITWLLPPHMQTVASIVFLGAVIISAWYGGTKAGLVAAAFSIFSFELLFHRTPETLESPTTAAARTLMFVAVSLLISFFEGQLRDALEQVEAANGKLQDTLDHVRHLESLLPICAGCKRIRNKDGDWLAIERYLHDAEGTNFTHGLCPACYRKYGGDDLKSAS